MAINIAATYDLRTVEIKGGLITLYRSRYSPVVITAYQGMTFFPGQPEFLLRVTPENKVIAHRFVGIIGKPPHRATSYNPPGMERVLGDVVAFLSTGGLTLEFESAYPEILTDRSYRYLDSNCMKQDSLDFFLGILTECINHDYLVNYAGG
jgi:hypothetical protein